MSYRGLISIVAVILVAAGAACAQAPAPLAMTNAAIGGGMLNQYTPGVEGGAGLNNIGLLIKTWGKVTFVDATNKVFYIDDGTGRNDGSGHLGIRCSYDNLAAGNSITPPNLNDRVSVIGVISTVLIDDIVTPQVDNKIQPNLRPRRQSDIEPR